MKEMDVVQRIKDEMDARKMTLTALSEKTGIGISEISKILAGHRRMRIDQLDKIADALEIPASILLMDEKALSFFLRKMTKMMQGNCCNEVAFGF